MSAAFFDTNIFAYAAESDGPDINKRDISRALLQARSIVVSTQVMMELYAVMVRKLRYAADTAYRWISSLEDETVISLSAQDVLEGIMISRRYEISHFDGLIIRAASLADLELLYTEDLNHGQVYGSVRACNPFIEDFLD